MLRVLVLVRGDEMITPEQWKAKIAENQRKILAKQADEFKTLVVLIIKEAVTDLVTFDATTTVASLVNKDLEKHGFKVSPVNGSLHWAEQWRIQTL